MIRRNTAGTAAAFIALSAVFAALLFHFCKQASAQTVQGQDAQAAALPELIKIRPGGYKPASRTKESELGRKYFDELNCMACHSIHNAGGDLAPILDGVGGRRNDEFLLEHLSSADSAVEKYKRLRGFELTGLLPHSRYSPEKAEALLAYLKTLPEPPGGFVVVPHAVRVPRQDEGSEPRRSSREASVGFVPQPKTAQALEGEKAFNKFGCIACHSIGEFGGWFGPRLDGVGARHTAAFISEHITDAQAHARKLAAAGTGTDLAPDEPAGSKMPRFTLSSQEVKSIVEYLLTLPALN